jgi:hypothetical protein
MQQQSISPNDVLRFILELAALGAVVWWGFGAAEAWPARVLLGVGVPAGLAAVWGTFRVPNDPKPDPSVEVAGPVRLLLEAVFFASAVAATLIAGGAALGAAFAAILVAHYAMAYRRVLHLIRDEPV